jgi:hypothetical protein
MRVVLTAGYFLPSGLPSGSDLNISNGFNSLSMIGINFATNRMNVHGAMNHRVRRIAVHHAEDRLDDLIALDFQSDAPRT